MVVVRRTLGGSYVLAELDGAIGKTKYAAFRIIPYFPRSRLSIPVTRLVGGGDDHGNETHADGEETGKTETETYDAHDIDEE